MLSFVDDCVFFVDDCVFDGQMAHTFEFLDDIATADLAFDAAGDSLQELFQGATCAVIEAHG
jgi:hypothetical protein